MPKGGGGDVDCTHIGAQVESYAQQIGALSVLQDWNDSAVRKSPEKLVNELITRLKAVQEKDDSANGCHLSRGIFLIITNLSLFGQTGDREKAEPELNRLEKFIKSFEIKGDLLKVLMISQGRPELAIQTAKLAEDKIVGTPEKYQFLQEQFLNRMKAIDVKWKRRETAFQA